jgi:cell division protein FtsN
MNKLMIAFLVGAFLISVSACQSKKKESEKMPVKKTVVHKPVVDTLKKDTLPEEPIAESQVEEPEVVKPDDKYFLISGSFQSMANAEKYKTELESKGYQSEVIVRKTGPNNDFYKVSYRSFYDREEAFSALRQEKQLPNNEHIWLLVKR